MGYEIIVAQTLNNAEREADCIRRLLARQVDGLFIRPVYRPDPSAGIYEELKKRKTPTVILGHRALFCSDFPNVETDDLAAAKAVTEHLLDLGHRRIACLTGPIFAPWAQERYEGYRRALMEHGLEVDEKLVFQAGATIEEGAAAALQFINEQPKATAMIAANDLVAFGAPIHCSIRAFPSHRTFPLPVLVMCCRLNISGFHDHGAAANIAEASPQWNHEEPAGGRIRQSQAVAGQLAIRKSTAAPAV